MLFSYILAEKTLTVKFVEPNLKKYTSIFFKEIK